MILVLELNSGGFSTSNKVFTKIVLKESESWKCCDNETFIFCCIGGVSFGNKISGVGFVTRS